MAKRKDADDLLPKDERQTVEDRQTVSVPTPTRRTLDDDFDESRIAILEDGLNEQDAPVWVDFALAGRGLVNDEMDPKDAASRVAEFADHLFVLHKINRWRSQGG